MAFVFGSGWSGWAAGLGWPRWAWLAVRLVTDLAWGWPRAIILSKSYPGIEACWLTRGGWLAGWAGLAGLDRLAGLAGLAGLG